jgi:hypothetical protein
MRHYIIGFSLSFPLICGAYEYPISADGLSFTPAGESAAFATVASGMVYAGRIAVNAVVPVFDRPTNVPINMKVAADAAKVIGKALVTRGPIIAGVALLAELAAQGIEAGGPTGWQKDNAEANNPSSLNGCWNIFDKCVPDAAAVVNQIVEDQNNTWPDVRGWYTRIKIGGSENFDVPDLTKGVRYDIWSRECNMFTLACSEWIAPHYSLTAIYIKPQKPPSKVPATPAEVESAIQSPVSDAVANEALSKGVPLPVEPPQGVNQVVTGVPYTPPGSAAPVMPYATITEGTKPGYLNVDYTLGAAVGSDTQTGPLAPGTTTTGTTTGTTTTTTGSTTVSNVTNNTTNTYNTENNYINTVTNNYPADTATEEKEYPDLCKDNPEAMACQEMGEAPEEDISKRDFNFSYTPFAISLPAACPAPYISEGVKIEYPCNAAQTMRPFLIGFASIVGLMMILAAIRS